MRSTIPFFVCSLLVGTAAAASAAQAVDRVSRVIPFDARIPIRLEATVANVTIAGSNRRDLRIEIVRRAPAAADLARFSPVIEAGGDGVRIAVLQEHDGRDGSLQAEIAIEAPSDAVIPVVRVFEGRVRITNIKGVCDVDLRRGAVEAAGLAGRIRLESGIGSVDVRDSELTPGGMMRLRVFNGPLRVRFAHAPVNGRILAVTFNGAIASDIPLTKKDGFGPRFGETTLGSGDPVLSMDVVKGDISISVPR